MIRLESGGLFILIGADAETAWLPPEIALDRHGYVPHGLRRAGRKVWLPASLVLEEPGPCLVRFRVAPEGAARVRVQMSAAIEEEHIDRTLAAFDKVGKELGLL